MARKDREAKYANIRRRPLVFEVGDRVFLKMLRAYRLARGLLVHSMLRAYRLALPPDLDMIRDITEKVKIIQKRMKTAQDREAKYANIRRRPLVFEVGDRVFLKISPFRGIVRFGKKGKLSPRYVGPYEILEKIGDRAYRLALPPSLSGIHDVFHVSIFRRYMPDNSHVIHPDEAELDQTLSYVERPVQILDRKEKQLRIQVLR